MQASPTVVSTSRRGMLRFYSALLLANSSNFLALKTNAVDLLKEVSQASCYQY